LAPLTLLYAATRNAWATTTDGGPSAIAPPDVTPASATIPATLANRAVWLQIAAFFTVTGLEATAGQWSFTLLTESRGLGTAAAGAWVGAFWTAFTLGRVAAGVVVNRVGAVRLTRLAALASVAGALLFAAAPVPAVGGAGLVLIGLAVAPLFPGLMAETPRRLGLATANHAVGFQISGAILGAAAVPGLTGVAADRFGLEVVTLVPIAAGLAFLVLNETLIASLDRRA
jgi:fucose permease